MKLLCRRQSRESLKKVLGNQNLRGLLIRIEDQLQNLLQQCYWVVYIIAQSVLLQTLILCEVLFLTCIPDPAAPQRKLCNINCMPQTYIRINLDIICTTIINFIIQNRTPNFTALNIKVMFMTSGIIPIIMYFTILYCKAIHKTSRCLYATPREATPYFTILYNNTSNTRR